MALYVEIMCDVRKEGHSKHDLLDHLCLSNMGNNPQGYSVVQAKKEAREQGWKLGPGNRAVCPGCASTFTPRV